MTGGGSKFFFSALFSNFFVKVDMQASTRTHQAPCTPKLPFWPNSGPNATFLVQFKAKLGFFSLKYLKYALQADLDAQYRSGANVDLFCSKWLLTLAFGYAKDTTLNFAENRRFCFGPSGDLWRP